MNKFLNAVIAIFCAFTVTINAYEGAIVEYNLVEGQQNIHLVAESERIGCTWSHGNIHYKSLIRQFYEILNAHEGHFVVLDIGAQTGCFTLLSKYFPNSSWYSFEPIPAA